jgi:DNA-binding Lrp family transcriptional regulator
MNLTDRDKVVFQFIQHRATEPIEKVAQELSLKSHIVRSTVKKLESLGLLRLATLYNPYKLGYNCINLRLQVSTNDVVAKTRFEERVSAARLVSWFAAVGGDFDYGMTLLARNHADLADFFEHLSEQTSVDIVRKEMVIETAQSNFGIKFLCTPVSHIPPVAWKIPANDEVPQLDELDLGILQSMISKGTANVPSLVREVGAAASTVQYRLSRLEKTGVVIGRLYRLNIDRLGFEHFYAYVRLGRLPSGVVEEVFDFCKWHPNIECCIRSVGSWDFKFNITAARKAEVESTVESFKQRFASFLPRVETMPLLRLIKYMRASLLQ